MESWGCLDKITRENIIDEENIIDDTFDNAFNWMKKTEIVGAANLVAK